MEQASGTTAPDPPRLAVTAAAGSMLETLLAAETAAEAAEREAAERLRNLRDRIKAELTQAHPGIEKFDIAGTAHRPSKTLSWVRTVRLNTTRLKAEQPRIYVEYAEFSGRWELRSARGL